nr:hypothetical protein [Tanacetum cinerariifolium]
VYVSKIPSYCPPMIFHMGDHWLQFGRKESTCSRPDIDNVEVAGDGMPIDNADGNYDIGIDLHDVLWSFMQLL